MPGSRLPWIPMIPTYPQPLKPRIWNFLQAPALVVGTLNPHFVHLNLRGLSPKALNLSWTEEFVHDPTEPGRLYWRHGGERVRLATL